MQSLNKARSERREASVAEPSADTLGNQMVLQLLVVGSINGPTFTHGGRKLLTPAL